MRTYMMSLWSNSKSSHEPLYGMMRRRIEQLAARVRLALVVVEEHAGATMELRDDDALGTVDDEGTGLGHQRDLAEVDLLLLDVAHDALATLAGVVDHELGRDLDRRRERHAALAALIDVVLRLLEIVRDVDELARAVEVLDREDAAEDRLEPDFPALTRRSVRLQELVVARLLDVDEVRDLDDRLHSSEVRAVPKVRLDLGRHLRSLPETTQTRTTGRRGGACRSTRGAYKALAR